MPRRKSEAYANHDGSKGTSQVVGAIPWVFRVSLGGGVKFIRFYHQSSLRVLDGFCRGRGLRIWGVDLGMYVSTIGSRPPRCHNLRWFSGVKGLWL